MNELKEAIEPAAHDGAWDANRQRQTVPYRMIRKTSQHSVCRLVPLSAKCSCVREDKVLRKVEVINSILSYANEESPL